MEINFISIFGNLNYIFICLAFLMRDILYLRVLAIFSSISAFIYYMFYLAEPLYIGVTWETVFITVNLVQICILLYERRDINLTKEEEKIYHTVFKHFLPFQFKKLISIGNFVDAGEGTILIEQGEKVENIMLVISGMADVIIDGKCVAHCKEGNFIGEISFLTERPATATVKVVQPLRYIKWVQQDLKDLLQSNRDIYPFMLTLFNKDLVEKLNK